MPGKRINTGELVAEILAAPPNGNKPGEPVQANRRVILDDDKLRRVFGKDKVTVFEMNKHLAQHLK